MFYALSLLIVGPVFGPAIPAAVAFLGTLTGPALPSVALACLFYFWG